MKSSFVKSGKQMSSIVLAGCTNVGRIKVLDEQFTGEGKEISEIKRFTVY